MDLPAEIRAMVEGMDSTTYNHSVRTWRFARTVEAYFCLGDDALSDAAYVHDVGKLFIPASNEPSAVLARAFGECREGQRPRYLQRGL